MEKIKRKPMIQPESPRWPLFILGKNDQKMRVESGTVRAIVMII